MSKTEEIVINLPDPVALKCNISKKTLVNNPKDNVPKGYELTEEGVFKIKASKKGEEAVPVCGPLWVEGQTKTPDGIHGRVLVFTTDLGEERRLVINNSRLHGDTSPLVKDLADMGLLIAKEQERQVAGYILRYATQNVIPSSPRLGWIQQGGKWVFVFPDKGLSADGEECVVYQPEGYSPTTKSMRTKGTLEEWQNHIGYYLGESNVLVLAACASLAAPCLKLAGMDSFVLHFHGLTSRGKTTALQVAASIFGDGTDPAWAASDSFLCRWNATANGLEGIAEAHSDVPLCLDEVGENTSKDLQALVYRVTSGHGKTAMTADRRLKTPREWRTIVLSSGEIPLEGRVSNQGVLKGGVRVRAIDVEVEDIAEGLPEDQRAAFVTHIKQACGQYFGTLGPRFIQELAKDLRDDPGFIERLRREVRGLQGDLKGKIEGPCPPELDRAMARFALISWAGQYASHKGLWSLSPEYILEAVTEFAKEWRETHGDTDQVRVLDRVREFILRNEARAKLRVKGVLSSNTPFDCIGIHDQDENTWEIYSFALEEAVPGYKVTQISKILAAAGVLKGKKGRHNAVQRRMGGERVRVYVIDGEALFGGNAGPQTAEKERQKEDRPEVKLQVYAR